MLLNPPICILLWKRLEVHLIKGKSRQRDLQSRFQLCLTVHNTVQHMLWSSHS